MGKIFEYLNRYLNMDVNANEASDIAISKSNAAAAESPSPEVPQIKPPEKQPDNSSPEKPPEKQPGDKPQEKSHDLPGEPKAAPEPNTEPCNTTRFTRS